ncbi:CbiX/SirB N-terminal domain-containing protein [Ramlibacter agri]|uniref:sirohydrochlorin chelatase n=1 Tax=Ramlibacter agri TaxID=2728837 RepID=UPI003159E37F
MKGVVLFGHGSRDPLWRLPMEQVATRVRTQHPGVPVRCAFLELEQPDLGTAAADLVLAGAREIVIVPMFLGAGRHAREDLPELVRQLQALRPDIRFTLQKPVGEDGRVLDLLAKIALE